MINLVQHSQFQSTPSARRATLQVVELAPHDLEISIHALREEGDSAWTAAPPSRQNFNPRPPRGGRRELHLGQARLCKISIHALREEGDLLYQRERRRSRIFQSTPSARRATVGVARLGDRLIISIHALREEGDGRTDCRPRYPWNFNPRPPRGGRPVRDCLRSQSF